MKIVNCLSQLSSLPKIITLGNFDGLHKGHQFILNQLLEYQKEEKTVLTFNPHPRVFYSPEEAIYIFSLEEKIRLFKEYFANIDTICVQTFDRDFSNLSARDFIKLLSQKNAKKILLGYDQKLGKEKITDFKKIQEIAKNEGMEVLRLDPYLYKNESISSSKIREMIKSGDIKKANFFLLTPYNIEGEVEHGNKIGKSIGFPTANIRVYENAKMTPKTGVYLVKVFLGKTQKYGVMNVGVNPSVSNGNRLKYEVNIFDFDNDIYNSKIKVELLDYIREENFFESIEKLKNQINLDVNRAKKIIETSTV